MQFVEFWLLGTEADFSPLGSPSIMAANEFVHKDKEPQPVGSQKAEGQWSLTAPTQARAS